eukprot:18683_4
MTRPILRRGIKNCIHKSGNVRNIPNLRDIRILITRSSQEGPVGIDKHLYFKRITNESLHQRGFRCGLIVSWFNYEPPLVGCNS